MTIVDNGHNVRLAKISRSVIYHHGSDISVPLSQLLVPRDISKIVMHTDPIIYASCKKAIFAM